MSTTLRPALPRPISLAMPVAKGQKPHIKIAYTLILLGMSLFMLERFGLDWMTGPSHTGAHLGGTMLSILVAAPMILIIAGCLVFAIGAMLRPR